MTKKDIAKRIADKIGLTQEETKEVVQRAFDAILDALVEDGRLELRNFGVFEVRQRKARQARNPKTGAKIDVPAKSVIAFKASPAMEEKVRQASSPAAPVAE